LVYQKEEKLVEVDLEKEEEVEEADKSVTNLKERVLFPFISKVKKQKQKQTRTTFTKPKIESKMRTNNILRYILAIAAVFLINESIFAQCDFTVGSNGFSKDQTCIAIIGPNDSLVVTSGIQTGYNNNYNYTWDFGDGSPILNNPGNVTQHAYNAPGVYIMTITANDPISGCTSTFIDTVFYLDRPLSSLSIFPTADICEGDTIFTINNTDTTDSRILYYVWEWGDGSLDTVTYIDTAFHLYNIGNVLNCTDVPQGGMPYAITLFAINECFEHTNSSPITVSRTPDGDLTANTYVECESVANSQGIEFNLDYCTYGNSG
jgi:hypothetical protein